MNYYKEYQVLLKKLRCVNQRWNNLIPAIEQGLKQNVFLENQLQFVNNFLSLKHKEIRSLEQNLASAENALVQKDSTIQELQGMLRKFIARYGEIQPKGQQHLDLSSQNYIVNTRIDKLEQRITSLQQAMESVNVLNPSEFEIFWKVTKEHGND